MHTNHFDNTTLSCNIGQNWSCNMDKITQAVFYIAVVVTSEALPSSNIQTTSGKAVNTHVIEKRDLKPPPLVGPSVENVSKHWEGIISTPNSASLQLQIRNYSKNTLNMLFTKRISGQGNQLPNIIEPGHMEVMLAWNDDIPSSSEVVLGWSYRQRKFCVLYWLVEQDEYCLSTECYSNLADAENAAQQVERYKNGTNENEITSNMAQKCFHHDIDTLKYCEPAFCIQGTVTMLSTAHPVAHISIFPLNISDWANETGITQDDLSSLGLTNGLLRKTLNPNKAEDYVEVVVYTLAAIAMFVIPIITAICCLERRKRREELKSAGEGTYSAFS